MDRLTKSGESGPFLVGPEVEEMARGGSSTRYTWVGTKSECEAKRAVARIGASMVSLRPRGDGNWELNVVYPNVPEEEGGAAIEPPTNQHDLDTSAEIVSVWQSPTLAARFTAAEIRLLKEVTKLWDDGAYQDGSAYVSSVTAWSTLTPAERAAADISRKFTTIGGNITRGQTFFNGITLRGVDKCYKYNTNYKRTITAASSIQVQAAYTGVGKIWTSSEVTSFEGVPTTEWFGLEASELWLKLPPRVTAAAGGKTSIEYVYQGGFTSASWFLYDAYSAAVLEDQE